MPFDEKNYQGKPSLDLAGLVAWLGTKDPDEQYSYSNPTQCVLCQWIQAATGFNVIYGGGGSYQRWGADFRTLFDSPEMERNVANADPYTFGGALIRARKLLAERQQ